MQCDWANCLITISMNYQGSMKTSRLSQAFLALPQVVTYCVKCDGPAPHFIQHIPLWAGEWVYIQSCENHGFHVDEILTALKNKIQ